MKRVGRVLLAAMVCSSLLGEPLFGQAITPQVKQSRTIDKATQESIDLAVSQHVQKLQDANPEAVRQAREALIGEARTPGGQPSPAFMAAYAAALSNVVQKFPKDAPPLSLLNLAIAVARVAESTQSSKLEGAVLWLLDDKQPEAAKLWGMKAARWIVPELAKLRQAKNLLPRVVATVEAHPTGSITAEAYAALQLEDPAVLDALLKAVMLRSALYQGPAAPQDPIVDYDPFFFLSVKVWPKLTQPQKVQTLQAICSLMVLGARHGDAAAPGTPEQEQLTTLFQRTAKALEAIAQQLGNKQLQSVASNASRALPMSPAAKEICPAIRQIPGFEAVKEPSMGGSGVEAQAPAPQQ